MKITKILQARKTIRTRKSKKNKNTPTENRDVKIIKKYTPRKTIQTLHRPGSQNYQKHTPTENKDVKLIKNTHTEKLYKRCADQQTKTCNYQKVSMLQIRKHARRNRSLRLAATAKSHECIVLNVLHRIIFGEGYDGCPPWRLSLCVSFFFSI